jgi:hypothetical protein
LIEIRGKIARNSKFWGQSRAKFKKITANDHFAKNAELWEQNWIKSGLNLKETKSLMVN